MTFQILTKAEAAGMVCSFEEWKSERKRMGCCGKTPIAAMGSKCFLCIEHLPDALIRYGQASLLEQKTGKKGVYPKSFSFKEDFLNAARKEDEARRL